MLKRTGIITSLLFTLVLAGCGGGGGGNGDGGNIGASQPPLEINAGNAMQVTAAVLDASGFVVDTGNPGGPITGVVVQGDGAQVDLAKVIRSRINLFSVLRDQNAAVLATGVIVSPTPQDCTTTGTVTVSGEIADPDLMQLTAGDTLTLVFEKEDLLVDHCGKDPAYNFYKYAGVATDAGGKGEHVKEKAPVNFRGNMP